MYFAEHHASPLRPNHSKNARPSGHAPLPYAPLQPQAKLGVAFHRRRYNKDKPSGSRLLRPTDKRGNATDSRGYTFPEADSTSHCRGNMPSNHTYFRKATPSDRANKCKSQTTDHYNRASVTGETLLHITLPVYRKRSIRKTRRNP